MKIKETWLTDMEEADHREMLERYLEEYAQFINTMPSYQQHKECLSGYNRMNRVKYWSSDALGIHVNVGDLCYLDYGHAYINEAGYQHFGLVVAIFNYKLFVVPMTSNASTIRQARNVEVYGKRHLYYLGSIEGLNKPSVLFLNDCKFINSSRVISVNGHLDVDSVMFREVRTFLKEAIFSDDVVNYD